MPKTKRTDEDQEATREKLPCGCDGPHPGQLQVYMCDPEMPIVWSCQFCSFWTYDATQARNHAYLGHVTNCMRTLRAIIKRA